MLTQRSSVNRPLQQRHQREFDDKTYQGMNHCPSKTITARNINHNNNDGSRNDGTIIRKSRLPPLPQTTRTTTFFVRTLRGNTLVIDDINILPVASISYSSLIRELCLRAVEHDRKNEDDDDCGVFVNDDDHVGNANDIAAREGILGKGASKPYLKRLSLQEEEEAFKRAVMVIYNGIVLTEDVFHNIVKAYSSISNDKDNVQHSVVVSVALHLRLLGGADRQNRVGSKFGGGGMASGDRAERDRKERLRELALESVDLAKDPYLMRNHLGTYECKLCLTLHTNEGNYLAHTQGKKHQAGLARRAAMEKKLAPTLPAANLVASQAKRRLQEQQRTRVRIGRPGYEISKSREARTNQRCLSFTLHYPEADESEDGIVAQPRHRFMSAYEQRVEVPDKRYQYLLLACEPYETVAFKIPNEPIDRGDGRFVTNWDEDARKFTLTLFFLQPALTTTTTTAGGGNP